MKQKILTLLLICTFTPPLSVIRNKLKMASKECTKHTVPKNFTIELATPGKLGQLFLQTKITNLKEMLIILVKNLLMGIEKFSHFLSLYINLIKLMPTHLFLLMIYLNSAWCGVNICVMQQFFSPWDRLHHSLTLLIKLFKEECWSKC